MSVKSSLVKQVEWKATGGSYTALTILNDQISIAVNNDLLGRAQGDQKTIARRRTIGCTGLDPGQFTAVNTAQQDAVTTEALKITWLDGSTSEFAGGRIIATPEMGIIPDLSEMGYGAISADPTGDPPSGIGWTTLGMIYADAGATLTSNTRPDGDGLPIWCSGSFEQFLEVPFANLSTVVGIDDGTARTIGITHPDGTYRRYTYNFVEGQRMDNYGADTHRTTQVRLFSTLANWLGTAPVIAQAPFLFDTTEFAAYRDWLTGFTCEFHVFGYDEADYLTEA